MPADDEPLTDADILEQVRVLFAAHPHPMPGDELYQCVHTPVGVLILSRTILGALAVHFANLAAELTARADASALIPEVGHG